MARLVLLVVLFLLGLSDAALAQSSQPRTVSFPSADGRTTLTGYLFAPWSRPKVAPAVILLPGRAGAYSPLAKGNFSSVTLEKRLRSWAELWAAQGYWAFVVDSLGPRGFAGGLPANGDGKVQAVAEAASRPYDAYGALKYLRSLPRIRADRIALQGWANGGTAALAAMSKEALPPSEPPLNGHGFRLALAFYPGCGSASRSMVGYAPYAPVRIFIGSRDAEASSATCEQLVTTTRNAGGDISLTLLPGAGHDFDDSARPRPAAPADPAAAAESRKQAVALLASALR